MQTSMVEEDCSSVVTDFSTDCRMSAAVRKRHSPPQTHTHTHTFTLSSDRLFHWLQNEQSSHWLFHLTAKWEEQSESHGSHLLFRWQQNEKSAVRMTQQSLSVPLTAEWAVSSQNDSHLLFHWQQHEKSAVRMTVTYCSTDNRMSSQQSEWQSLTVPLTAAWEVISQNDSHLLFHWQQKEQSEVRMTITYCSTDSRISSQQSKWQSNHLLFHWLQN